MTPVLFLDRRGARLLCRDAARAALSARLPGRYRRHPAEALPGVGNYLDFSTRFIFGFGVAFLLPVLLMLLERAGLVTRAAAEARPPLRDRRRLRRRRGADPARRGLAAAARGAAGRCSTRSRWSRSGSPSASGPGRARPPHKKGRPRRAPSSSDCRVEGRAGYVALSTALDADSRSSPAPRTVLQALAATNALASARIAKSFFMSCLLNRGPGQQVAPGR